MRTGAFPQTPAATVASRRNQNANQRPRASLPNAPEKKPGSTPQSQPLIPLSVIEAPTQRLYAIAFWAALLAWRLYDYAGLVEDDTTSFWLFVKWTGLDFAYLVLGIPHLKIPWLEFSPPVTITLFFLHVAWNGILMFNVDVPLQPWLIGFVKLFYDRELSISEHSVKVSNILHNSSLIMGKQIINILPEGCVVHQLLSLFANRSFAEPPFSIRRRCLTVWVMTTIPFSSPCTSMRRYLSRSSWLALTWKPVRRRS